MTNLVPGKTRKLINALATERILVLDGAMGTMIQSLGLDEEGYRGAALLRYFFVLQQWRARVRAEAKARFDALQARKR